jgi:LIVCS family branched-chain amino acid:cation transporter
MTFIFSLPDVLGTIKLGDVVAPVAKWIPLASQSLGWVIPALVTFVLVNLFQKPK